MLSKNFESPDKLIKEVDRKLVRGCTIHNIEPLTMIHSTQRMVHSLMKKLDVTPSNPEQEMFEKLAEFTMGSPVIVEIASQVVVTCYDQLQHRAMLHLNKMLSLEHKDVSKPDASSHTDNIVSKLLACSYQCQGAYQTDSMYDSWDSITKLVGECHLSSEERLLLNCLSIFGCSPIPFSLVIEMSSAITKTSQKAHLAGTLHQNLLKFKLLKPYPLPVVLHPTILKNEVTQVPEFLYVPQQLAQCLWNSMEVVDKIVVLSVTYATVSLLHRHSTTSIGCHDISGICSLLHEVFEENYVLVGEECYQQMYSLFLRCK